MLDRDEAEVEKKLELPSGGVVVFRMYPPHGMWRIHFERGQTPERVKGDYTSYNEAKRAWDAYYLTRPVLQKPSPKERLKAALAD
jgi:hypothetical protein